VNRLVLITDPAYAIDRIVEVIETCAPLVVQLRDKTSPFDVFEAHAQRLRRVARDTGSLLVLNALREGPVLDLLADGYHVACNVHAIERARRLTTWVSTPAHTDDDVRVAEEAGATAVLVSPIFASPGKGDPRGMPALTSARALTRATIYALGGIDASNVSKCAEAGADGVAVIRSLLDATDTRAVARALTEPFGA
jgi:thiamine-phosphate pyrophosphorylase